MMKEGFYERIVTDLLANELNNSYITNIEEFKKDLGIVYLNRFFQQLLFKSFNQIKSIEEIVELSNKIIDLIGKVTGDKEILKDKISTTNQILKAIFLNQNNDYKDFDQYVKGVFPSTGLSQSNLFSGGKKEISLESELRKEMQTSDEVWWLVSFVKFEGVRLFEQTFKQLNEKSIPVKIICTVYMGATDLKAIEFLSGFDNVEIKISFNIQQERLHAKSYMFRRNSGFHTAYIGSSNLSKSALTNGLEWNLKVTSQEVPHIIQKSQSTFETYWNDSEFVLYNKLEHHDLLKEALNVNSIKSKNIDQKLSFFDIKPFPFQQEILDQLIARRELGENRNLIVAATGTGKTVIAAFDFNNFLKSNPNCRFLFIAHRREILEQARGTFRQILKNSDFGDLWFSGSTPKSINQLFVSIQTMNNNIDKLVKNSEYYDYIVIDEVHHSAASSYQKLLEKFKPKLLIGLTATPERHDGNDISIYFGNTISAEIRLPEALNRKLLCPFHYFGVSASIDISGVEFKKGKYDLNGLEKVYTESDRIAIDVFNNCNKYLKDVNEVTALGYCVTKKHASFMSEWFNKFGVKAAVLTSDQNEDRSKILNQFKSKEINYLFVVDIFNEGIDIPQIDTLIFLRPTESLTVFLQQLGRGLRLSEGKTCLTVLDFVGHAHEDYDFEHKFKGMLGKTHSKIKDEIETDFPHLPLGCSIILEKTAKEIILKNITKHFKGGKSKIINEIKKFRDEYLSELNFVNFCNIINLSLNEIYTPQLLWFELIILSNGGNVSENINNSNLARAMSTSWISADSLTYFKFIEGEFSNGFSSLKNIENEKFLLMLFVDIYRDMPSDEINNYAELQGFFRSVFSDIIYFKEIKDYFAVRIPLVDSLEKTLNVDSKTNSLRVHGRYTREQVLVEFEKTSYNKKGISREGVLSVSEKNIEVFFVTLDKSDGKYNPNTMYQDYFINDKIFHWQSQNKTSDTTEVGKSYINQKASNKVFLLFVREANNDENDLTMGFVYCGELIYLNHNGNKPMNINWQMQIPPPANLLNEGKKLAVG
jgi:superfamily II DNA or RNA helicase/HKD family nuclease